MSWLPATERTRAPVVRVGPRPAEAERLRTIEVRGSRLEEQMHLGIGDPGLDLDVDPARVMAQVAGLA